MVINDHKKNASRAKTADLPITVDEMKSVGTKAEMSRDSASMLIANVLKERIGKQSNLRYQLISFPH